MEIRPSFLREKKLKQEGDFGDHLHVYNTATDDIITLQETRGSKNAKQKKSENHRKCNVSRTLIRHICYRERGPEQHPWDNMDNIVRQHTHLPTDSEPKQKPPRGKKVCRPYFARNVDTRSSDFCYGGSLALATSAKDRLQC